MGSWRENERVGKGWSEGVERERVLKAVGRVGWCLEHNFESFIDEQIDPL